MNLTGSPTFSLIAKTIPPLAVIYDGLLKAKEMESEIVIIDTAGRLQNKVGLMAELEKDR